ncbi:MAG TPA: methionine--tRNA ligase subunit beta [Acidobacteriaceae bacterium]|nr:methionine--tRNA ligase subunit beta [Acidobacteriaceae bacterium]
MPDTPQKFYLTTPIYYVNARPHIGHAYSTIAADVIARRHRLLGDDTFFLTGTDEHGQKVQRSAEKAGIPPQQFTDQVSATFRDLWARMGITNDDYIRTTDDRHKRGVQKLWRDLEANGAIYLSTYTGQYSVGEEMFIDGPPGTLGPDGKPTETVTEENYFFRLSDFQLPLIDLIESTDPHAPLHIQPEAIRNEVLSFLRGGLKDLSISRTTFDWGVPVPGNPKHVIYVWLDALANYMTAIGYGSDSPADQAKFAKYWPADLHLVGKEITRFHCVYWPAFLLALNPKLKHAPDEPTPHLTPAEHAEWAAKWLPKSVVANGWLLFEESKMSKSRGNVIRTETILDTFGPLCPPVHSPPGDTSASATDAGSRDDGGSSGLQPAESTPKDAGALAPCLTPPTKAQQDLFASDVIRYFLLREIPFGQDGSFSFDALITRYNADLANGYGNLVSRTLKMIETYFSRVIPPHPALEVESVDSEVSFTAQSCDKLRSYLIDAPSDAAYRFERHGFHSALEGVLQLVGSLDLFLTEQAPWRTVPGLSADLTFVRRALILYTAAESIRLITALLYPIMPYATASVWRQLGLGDIEEAARKGELKDLTWGGLKPGTKLGPLAPIFPRADKGLAQIMNEMEAANATAAAKTTTTDAPLTESFSDIKPIATQPEASATQKSETPEPTPTPTITIDDFIKVDLRVGQIAIAERIPKADKLLRLEVDLGPILGRRQILSGIAEHYTPEELIGRRIAVIANLAPRKMRGLESHGMLLAASDDAHTSKPILATFSDEVPLGSRIR